MVWLVAWFALVTIVLAGGWLALWLTSDGYRGTRTATPPRQPVQRGHRASDLDEGTVTIRRGRYYPGRGV
jgi:hypothetical protein